MNGQVALTDAVIVGEPFPRIAGRVEYKPELITVTNGVAEHRAGRIPFEARYAPNKDDFQSGKLTLEASTAGLALGAVPVASVAAAVDAPARSVGAVRPLKADVRELGEKVAKRAVAFLKSKQDEKSGGWSVPPKGPSFPAITGLVVNGMLLQGTDVKDRKSVV